jgi:arsenite transporter
LTVGALLLTLVLIFAFQSKSLTTGWVVVLLIAVPIIVQVYFNSGLTPLRGFDPSAENLFDASH